MRIRVLAAPTVRTGVRLPSLAQVFIWADKELAPDEYRKQNGRCPPGWHVDEESGRCVTVEQLLNKLQKQQQQPPKQEAKPAPTHGPGQYRKEKTEADPEFAKLLAGIKAQTSLARFLPRSVRKAVSKPFQFLTERFRQGSDPWSRKLQSAEHDLIKKPSPLDQPNLTPDQERKMIKQMARDNSAPGRFLNLAQDVGGRAARWFSRGWRPCMQDVARGTHKAAQYCKSKIGDLAQAAGDLAGKHKVAGSGLAKVASGRFKELTSVEKAAMGSVVFEAVEAVALSYIASRHRRGGTDLTSKAHEHVKALGANADPTAVSDSMVDAIGSASEQEAGVAGQIEFMKDSMGDYWHKTRMLYTAKLVDAEIETLAHGSSHDHTSAGFISAAADPKKFLQGLTSRVVPLLENFKADDPSAALKGLQGANSVFRAVQIAKAGRRHVDTAQIAKDVTQYTTTQAGVAEPGDDDWYDFAAVQTAAMAFSQRVKALLGELYHSTFMTAPPHEGHIIRNYGDVVVELSAKFQAEPAWKKNHAAVGAAIHKFEAEYPGLSFAVGAVGSAPGIIQKTEHRYQTGTGATVHFYEIK